MENLKSSSGQYLVEAMALTTIAAFIALIISSELIRLLGSLRISIAPSKQSGSKYSGL